MNNRTRIILRYLFIVLFGVFLHYAYELSGGNPIVGLFALVNESVWEHLKLLFFPFLTLTIWDSFTHYKNNLHFLPPRTISILIGMAFQVTCFYTITGIIGRSIAWVNILIFLLSALLVFIVEKYVCRKCCRLTIFQAIAILVLWTILFIVFTIAPPALGIFIPMAE